MADNALFHATALTVVNKESPATGKCFAFASDTKHYNSLKDIYCFPGPENISVSLRVE